MNKEIGRREALIAAGGAGAGLFALLVHSISQPDPDMRQAIQACKEDQANPNFAEQNPNKVLTNLEVTQAVNVRTEPTTDSYRIDQLAAGTTISEAYPTRYDSANETEWVGFTPNGNCDNMKYIAEKYTRRGIFSPLLPR